MIKALLWRKVWRGERNGGEREMEGNQKENEKGGR